MSLRVEAKKDSFGKLSELKIWTGKGKPLSLRYEWDSDGLLQSLYVDGRKGELPSISELSKLVNDKFIERIGRIGNIELIQTIQTLDNMVSLGKIDAIDLISVIKTIETIGAATVADVVKVATRKTIDVVAGAAGDSAIWTPTAGYKIRLKLFQYESSADVEVGLRFGTTETSWARRTSAGTLGMNLIGCNLEGAINEALNLRAEGAVNVNGFVIGDEILVQTPATETVRPSPDYISEWFYSTDPLHHDAVDEVALDQTTYLRSNPSNNIEKDDLFDFSHTVPASATIQGIEVFLYAKSENDDIKGQVKPIISIDGTIYAGAVGYPSGKAYQLLSHSWSKNPATGLDWTLTEIGDLKIGVRGRSGLDPEIGYSAVRVSQVYAVISYSS